MPQRHADAMAGWCFFRVGSRVSRVKRVICRQQDLLQVSGASPAVIGSLCNGYVPWLGTTAAGAARCTAGNAGMQAFAECAEIRMLGIVPTITIKLLPPPAASLTRLASLHCQPLPPDPSLTGCAGRRSQMAPS